MAAHKKLWHKGLRRCALLTRKLGLAKQSKAVEVYSGPQLLSMVGQWWAQSQAAAACILSQVPSNLRAVSQKPVTFRAVSDEWYGSTTTRFG